VQPPRTWQPLNLTVACHFASGRTALKGKASPKPEATPSHEDLTPGRVTFAKKPHYKKSSNVAKALVVVSLPARDTFTARKEDKTSKEAIRKIFHAVSIEARKFRLARFTVNDFDTT
jgi:hypothetical protein